MYSPSSSQTSARTSWEDFNNQLYALCMVQGGVTNICKKLNGTEYASHEPTKETYLNDFENFLCKVAMTLHWDKSPNSIAALSCLSRPNGGGEFLFAFNCGRQAELEEAKSFLERLFEYVSTNPDKLNDKPLQKQVLWRILERTIKKVDGYLKLASMMLEVCVKEKNLARGFSEQLGSLQRRLVLPLDMTNVNAKQKSMKDCESFINAIEVTKNTAFSNTIDNLGCAGAKNSTTWRLLQHCLSCLHSYRQAAEAIVKACVKWPGLFKKPKVNFIQSAKPKIIPLPESREVRSLLECALPGMNMASYEPHIRILENHGLDESIQDFLTDSQILGNRVRTFVHSEVQLHDHLIQQGKTEASDFFQGNMFIATSKPPCQLCHYYFQCFDNNFHVQEPHMNLYPKWRFGDSSSEEMMEEVVEQLGDRTSQMLKEKVPQWKRFDSRTESYGGTRNSTSASHRMDFDKRIRQRMQQFPSPPPEDYQEQIDGEQSDDDYVEDEDFYDDSIGNAM